MIADQDPQSKTINGAGIHEPLKFDWRVTGYFKPDLLDDHIQRIAQGTHKYLCDNHWPPKDLQYDISKVEPVLLYSREELNDASFSKTERLYSALQVRITLVLQRRRIFVPQNVVDLFESLCECLFPTEGLGMGFRDYLPIDGQEAANHLFSEVQPCFTDALWKVMEGEPLEGIIMTHKTTSKHFSAFAIEDHLRKLGTVKHGSTHPLRRKSADMPNNPEAVQIVMAELLNKYLRSHEDFQRTIATACNEGTISKSIKNVVTNIGLMECSMGRLIDIIECRVGKSIPGTKSRFFVKRWIKKIFRIANSPTICLDSENFDVEQCKRALHNRLAHYQRVMRYLVTSVHFLDPAAREEFKKVVDSTPNTPDKAECLRLYGQDGTREQALRSIDEMMETAGCLHRKILEQLHLLNTEIARTMITTISLEFWWDSTKKKCLESDDSYYYFNKAVFVSAKRQ